MSSTVAPTLEPVCIAKIGVFIMADDGAPLIDSGGKDAGVRVENNVENKRSDGRATGRAIDQNSLPCRVNSVSSDHWSRDRCARRDPSFRSLGHLPPCPINPPR